MNKVFTRLVAGMLIASQLTGCLATVPTSMGELNNFIGVQANELLGGPASYKGAMSADEQATARLARSMFRSAESGVIGYSQPEYQRRLARFHSARADIKAVGKNFTQAQFIEMSSALTDLLLYVDQIEQPARPKHAARTLAAGSGYQVAPGQIASFEMNGFCLSLGPDKPAGGEGMQLIDPVSFWSGQNASVYRNLINMSDGSATRSDGYGFTSKTQQDLQVAMWALAEMNKGALSPRIAKSITPQQKQMLTNAGVSPLKLEAQVVGVNAFAKYVDGALSASPLLEGMSQYSGVMQAANRAIAMPADIMGNPQILSNPELLQEALSTWINAPELPPVTTARDALDQYSLLAPGVAAKTISGDRLDGHFQVVNASDTPFTFSKADFVANARSSTQPVGISRIALAGSKDVKVAHSAEDNAIRKALLNDLQDLANDKLFDFLTNKDSKMLGYAKSLFKSKLAQQIVTDIPVIGNIISLSLLMGGKNLDGSDMNAYDYASAAIGVVPVVGNIAKALGGSAKVAAQAISRMGKRIPEGTLERIDDSIQLASTDTHEVINTPGWMSREFEAISSRVLASLQSTPDKSNATPNG